MFHKLFSLVFGLSTSGDNEIRTRDPLLARQVLSQLSYTPKGFGSHLSSRTVSSEVLSAVWVLTIVFGMGTGVTPRRIATKYVVIQLLVRSCGLAYLVFVSLILDGVNPSYTSSACHIRESQLSVCSSLSAVHSLIDNQTVKQPLLHFLRKEVIQPHLPIRLPCYDFTPVINPTFDCVLLR